MVSLNCPLCCNETFPSHTSLKCHLLNILENLICPSCHEKFDKLTELANHLESNCTQTYFIETNETQKLEVIEENENHDSILAKALLASPRREVIEKTEAVEEDSQYYCQMCLVHFDDIDEHLNNYHDGQEIILEEESEIENNSDQDQTVYIIEQADEVQENDFKESATKKSNTITQQEFKDKDGRLYTRKFVKIEKFWLDKNNDENIVNTPVVQKYLVDDGSVKKLTTEEASQIENKDSIIEINQCPKCNLYFPVMDLYKKHKCTNSDKLNCDHCPLVFDDVELLSEHSKIHATKENCQNKKSPVGPFNCETCNTTFPTFKSLRLHRRMHDPIKTREIEAPAKYGLTDDDIVDDKVRHMFICTICNKTYDKQYEFIHMNSHSSNNGYNCDVCNRKFFTQSNLEMHLKAHSNNKKFTCSYCKKPFVTYDSLNDHLSNQCQKRPYACQFCGRRFARPHEKVKHERIHTGEKPHVCDICGKAFRVSYCLTLHLRTHSGTRPYQCKHCGKRFKSHSVYNHHLLTHSDVRAYKCPYCPKAFKTSVQLAGHKNSHIKPFTCTECNRPFASLYAVRAHMETHKRDNNLKYECWMCGALYSRAFALRDHLKQQHQQVDGDKTKAKAVALSVDEEMEAANSILVSEDDIILGLDGTANIEIIENETE